MSNYKFSFCVPEVQSVSLVVRVVLIKHQRVFIFPRLFPFSEAEYAFSLRKDIVPLMMQDQYRADGWLGMVVGSKLWFPFAGVSKFETSLEALKKELGERGKADCGEPIVKG